MALFMDGPACTVDDLTAHDSGLLDTALTEGIDVAKKIQLAVEEMTPELQIWLDRRRYYGAPVWQPVLKMQQVVVTPALRRWQQMLALTLFYRDAYFSHLVDRYQAKWQAYAQLTTEARERFVDTGLAIAQLPVPQAGLPVLGSAAGPQPGGTYYASVSWLNIQGLEGQASPAASLTVSDGNVMTVVPGADYPGGNWNVYAGTSLDGMYLQNPEPLGAGDMWSFVPGAVTSGQLLSAGQNSDFVIPLIRTSLRG